MRLVNIIHQGDEDEGHHMLLKSRRPRMKAPAIVSTAYRTEEVDLVNQWVDEQLKRCGIDLNKIKQSGSAG